MQLTYIGNSADAVHVADTDIVIPPDQRDFEVDAELAGTAPKGKPGEEGYDPGSGLLAQTENFARSSTKAAKAVTQKETP